MLTLVHFIGQNVIKEKQNFAKVLILQKRLYSYCGSSLRRDICRHLVANMDTCNIVGALLFVLFKNNIFSRVSHGYFAQTSWDQWGHSWISKPTQRLPLPGPSSHPTVHLCPSPTRRSGRVCVPPYCTPSPLTD